MQSVIDQNNDSACLIEAGKYREALDVLGHAMTRVQAELHSKDDHEDPRRAHQDIYSCQWAKQIRAQHMMQPFDAGEIASDFIYRHPILAVNLPEYDAEYLLSVMLVFNMALCHHLLAIGGRSQGKSQRLKGALKLYELGFSLQMQTDVNMDMTFALAMVNNCAQIYKALDHHEKAGLFYSHLVSSLMMMIENGEAGSVCELEGFLLSASRVILKETVASAA